MCPCIDTRTLADCVDANERCRVLAAVIDDVARNPHVVCRAARIVLFERRNPILDAVAIDRCVPSHSSHIDTEPICSRAFPLVFPPAFLRCFNPLHRDKHIIGHFRKFAENLFAEQVFGAIPFSLEAEVVEFFLHLRFVDTGTPLFEFIDNPFVIDLSGDDDFMFNDVRSGQAVQPEFRPAFPSLAAGSISDRSVGVEYQQDTAVAL